MNKIKIGFDISQTGSNKAGCGYFAESLILALTRMDDRNSYILYPRFGGSFFASDSVCNTQKIKKPNVTRKLIGKNFNESVVFWTNLKSHGEGLLGNPDIIHSNNYSCPKGLSHAKVVYTLHDLSFIEYPEFTTDKNRCVCFDGVFNAAVSADFIISVSDHSRKIFLEIFPHYPPQRIKVVHEVSRFVCQNIMKQSKPVKNLKPSEFWLTVGTLEPRKNFRRLFKSFARFRNKTTAQFPLVHVGGKGWLEDDLEGLILDLGLSDAVYFLGYQSDEELCWLYQNCFSFVYPSLYEGFGLPVLEAMELGAAVITSNLTSLPEVAGNAAHYVDPYSEQDIEMAFKKLFIDENFRLSLKNRAVIQAKKFSWDRCASEVFNIYNQVMNMPKFGSDSS